MKKKHKEPAILELVRKGVKARMTDIQIAEGLGVTRQYVFILRKKFDIKRPKPIILIHN